MTRRVPPRLSDLKQTAAYEEHYCKWSARSVVMEDPRIPVGLRNSCTASTWSYHERIQGFGYYAQHESFATSLVKVCAASLSASPQVRYGCSVEMMSRAVSPKRIASVASLMMSPPLGGTR